MSESITYEPIQLDLFFDLDNAKAESSVINQKISSLSDSKTKRNSIATVGIVGAIVGGGYLSGYINPGSNDAIMKGTGIGAILAWIPVGALVDTQNLMLSFKERLSILTEKIKLYS